MLKSVDWSVHTMCQVNKMSKKKGQCFCGNEDVLSVFSVHLPEQLANVKNKSCQKRIPKPYSSHHSHLVSHKHNIR